jgi:WhiB family redox-sensing transcriptional regulator
MTADWRTRAACRGMETDMFFPERGDGAAVDAAKTVCGTCPVAADCLDEAINLPDGWGEIGIWGGTSGRQRRILVRTDPELRKERQVVIDHGTEAGYAAHRRRDEQPCDRCRWAHNEAHAAYKRARRGDAA